MSEENYSLLSKQLSEFKEDVDKKLDKIDDRLVGIEKRLSVTETDVGWVKRIFFALFVPLVIAILVAFIAPLFK